ncbi:MAG: 50S ribosomal protein L15 [Candidatus Izemoplasmatales bacterium]|uniref:Large ribosomal subunit protein uL15 n=1 Tax=Hujiaoplasma nucleasis TaxID=2725268 RepID=A0A7L6N261_9MOLU|nr:50S ribosomal protein L15 [Hujiaoplasma nucleasis]QLY40346.1 50S ribosomal protein L15 [Hujiaoplasma nucleasis]
MKLHELRPNDGATHYKKRVGRGSSSGLGKTSGRGQKGQNSRSGGGTRLGFEGGQTPLFKRLPKKGFTNPFRKEFAVVNLSDLNRYEENTEVTPELLLEDKVIRKELDGVKILGRGKLEVKLTVKAHKFSASAKEAIEAAGGTIEVI